jgi:hypothetical protein
MNADKPPQTSSLAQAKGGTAKGSGSPQSPTGGSNRRSRHDLRGAVRSLATVLRKVATCLDSLVLKGRQVDERLKRIEAALRERALVQADVSREPALGGPYWEARHRALHERENWEPGGIQWVEMGKFSDVTERVASNFEPVPGKPGLMRRKGLPDAALEFLKAEGKQDREDRIAAISGKLDAQAKPVDQDYQASIARAQSMSLADSDRPMYSKHVAP